MNKVGCDERHEWIMEESGAKSFSVMFLVCSALSVCEISFSIRASFIFRFFIPSTSFFYLHYKIIHFNCQLYFTFL